MNLKTLEETKTWLKGYAEGSGLGDIYQAAADVLSHYNAFDHQGEDKLFMAFCEEIEEEGQSLGRLK